MKAVMIDDNPIFAEQFCKKVTDLAGEQKICLEMDLLSEENKEEILSLRKLYDIYFLDIEMPGKTGIELAKELRKKHLNRELIFVSAYEYYMRKVFPVKPLYFIRKAFLEEDLKEAILVIKEQQELQAIQLPLGKEMLSISPYQILYGQSVEHYVKLVAVDREQELPLLRMKLEQVEKKLEVYYFIRVHERYLVNLRYVEQIRQGEVLKLRLENGVEIPVSRSRRKEIQKMLLEWFEKHR